VWLCLRDPTFSCFSRRPICVSQTDRQAEIWTNDGIYRASIASRGNHRSGSSVNFDLPSIVIEKRAIKFKDSLN